MPAYNAVATLEMIFRAISEDWIDEVVLVDDASRDGTVELARELGIETIVHPVNRGYGANQKTCYREALARGADIIVMLHPDGQYDPETIPDMVDLITSGEVDFVLGSRFLSSKSPLDSGMPRYKYYSNRFLTWIENGIMGTALSECHCGYRAYSRKLLKVVPFMKNSDDFVFDTQMLFQIRHFGFGFAEVSVATRYFTEASSIGLLASTRYGAKTLLVALSFLLHRYGVKKTRIFEVDII